MDGFPSIAWDAECNHDISPAINVDDYFSAAATTSREVFKRKERVRAKKAGTWIRSDRMVANLAQVVAGTAPTERYLHFLLKEHGEETWTGEFGLQQLPLVNLCQPAKSPAVSVLNEYWMLQTSPVETSLECLVGQPGVDMLQEQETFFQFLVDMASSVWKKLVAPHYCYPWSLAAILDPDCPHDFKVNLLRHFFSQSDCCLDDGASIPLKQRFSGRPVEERLAPSSDFMRAVVTMFTSKITNVEIENNFARSTSARAYLRGQRHCAATMSCKHLVAELKQQHLKSLDGDKQSKSRKRKRDAAADDNLPALSRKGANLQAGGLLGASTATVSIHGRANSSMAMPHQNRTRSDSSEKKKQCHVNGWIICMREAFDDPILPGETKRQRYDRIRAEAVERFKDEKVRRRCSLKAKEENKRAKDAATGQDGRPSGLLALPAVADQLRAGPWGAGDVDFPIAKASIAEKLQEKAFIKRHHTKFCEAWLHVTLCYTVYSITYTVRLLKHRNNFNT